jgi:hypothetical protein
MAWVRENLGDEVPSYRTLGGAEIPGDTPPGISGFSGADCYPGAKGEILDTEPRR